MGHAEPHLFQILLPFSQHDMANQNWYALATSRVQGLEFRIKGLVSRVLSMLEYIFFSPPYWPRSIHHRPQLASQVRGAYSTNAFVISRPPRPKDPQP